MAREVGNLAAGFLQAFAQTRMMRERQTEQEEERKARLKLYELQLKQMQQQTSAQGKVFDLMSPQAGQPGAMPVPQFGAAEGGLGLEQTGISQQGMGPKPGRSLSQLLVEMQGSPEIAQAVMQSGMLPQFQQADQMFARSELANQLPTSGGMSDPNMMGLAVRAGLPLPQESTRVPNVIALMQAANIDPQGKEGQELIRASIRGEGNMLDGLRAQLMVLQTQQAQAQLATDERARLATERTAKASTKSLLRNATEMAELNDRLEGTILQTGVPMTELRKGAASLAGLLEPFGFDMKQTQQAVDDFNRFNKLAEQMVIDMLPKLAEAGTITDTKYDSLQRTLASSEVSPGANRLVLADIIEMGVESADKLGMDLDDRKTLEEAARKLRGSSRATEGGWAIIEE